MTPSIAHASSWCIAWQMQMTWFEQLAGSMFAADMMELLYILFH